MLIPCLRATSVGVSSEPRLSATIWLLWSAVQDRRRSPRVMISIRGFRALVRLVVRALSSIAEWCRALSIAELRHAKAPRRNVWSARRLREPPVLERREQVAEPPLVVRGQVHRPAEGGRAERLPGN